MGKLLGGKSVASGLAVAACGILLSQTNVAQAQVSGEEATNSEKESTSEPPAGVQDGARFRFGVAGGLGFLSGAGYSFTYTGVDLRFGVQLSDMIAVYAQPQIGGYWTKPESVNIDGTSIPVSTGGGLMGASVLADVTLIDRFFVGGGLGYGILNNPGGPELHFRAGGYPLMGRNKEKARRKGLMLGVDFRLHFLKGATFVAPTFNIGYDAF
jgi:hypothetical protein